LLAAVGVCCLDADRLNNIGAVELLEIISISDGNMQHDLPHLEDEPRSFSTDPGMLIPELASVLAWPSPNALFVCNCIMPWTP
jgi:hypothetical protein